MRWLLLPVLVVCYFNGILGKTVTTEGSKWHDLRSKRTVNITLDDTESRPGVNVFMYLDYADEFQIRFDANINQCKFKINLTRRDGGSKRLIFGFNANKEPKNETILQERFFIVHFHWSPKRIQFLSGGAIAIGHEIKGSCASSDEKRQNRTLYHGRIRTNNINRMYLDVTYLPDETVLNEVKQKDTDITIEIQEMLDANKLLAIILGVLHVILLVSQIILCVSTISLMKQKMKIKWKRANLDNLYLAVKKAADENGVGLMENCSEIQTTSVAMEEPKKDTEQKSRTDSIKKKVTTSQNQQL